jgi:hypothetical protein
MPELGQDLPLENERASDRTYSWILFLVNSLASAMVAVSNGCEAR